jgi:hypothetical protein
MEISESRNYSEIVKKEYVHEIAFVNGRDIRREHFNEADRLSDFLGLNCSEKVSKSFALLPTKTQSGWIFFSLYWAYSQSENSSSLYRTVFRFQTKDRLVKELTRRKILKNKDLRSGHQPVGLSDFI